MWKGVAWTLSFANVIFINVTRLSVDLFLFSRSIEQNDRATLREDNSFPLYQRRYAGEMDFNLHHRINVSFTYKTFKMQKDPIGNCELSLLKTVHSLVRVHQGENLSRQTSFFLSEVKWKWSSVSLPPLYFDKKKNRNEVSSPSSKDRIN